MTSTQLRHLRLGSLLLAAVACPWATGCKTHHARTEVHTEQRIEVHEESEPQMVSPGEMVVE